MPGNWGLPPTALWVVWAQVQPQPRLQRPQAWPTPSLQPHEDRSAGLLLGPDPQRPWETTGGFGEDLLCGNRLYRKYSGHCPQQHKESWGMTFTFLGECFHFSSCRHMCPNQGSFQRFSKLPLFFEIDSNANRNAKEKEWTFPYPPVPITDFHRLYFQLFIHIHLQGFLSTENDHHLQKISVIF